MTDHMERWRAEQARDSLQKAFEALGRENGRLRDLIQSIYEMRSKGLDILDAMAAIDDFDREENEAAQHRQELAETAIDAYRGL